MPGPHWTACTHAEPAALTGTAPGHSLVSRWRKEPRLAQPLLPAGGWNLEKDLVQDRFWSRTRGAEIKQQLSTDPRYAMGRAKKMPACFAQGVVCLLTAGGLIRVRRPRSDRDAQCAAEQLDSHSVPLDPDADSLGSFLKKPIVGCERRTCESPTDRRTACWLRQVFTNVSEIAGKLSDCGTRGLALELYDRKVTVWVVGKSINTAVIAGGILLTTAAVLICEEPEPQGIELRYQSLLDVPLHGISSGRIRRSTWSSRRTSATYPRSNHRP
jgi:hypothetical protein